MFYITQPVLQIEGDLYLVQREVRESNKPNIRRWASLLGSDRVVKKNGFVFFCEKIEEVEIIEEQKLIENEDNTEQGESPSPTIG